MSASDDDCPFPYAGAPACSETQAEIIGSAYDAVNIVYAVTAVMLLTVSGYQLKKLAECQPLRGRFINLPVYIRIATTIGAGLRCLQAIDLYGYRDWTPIEFSDALANFQAAFGMGMAVKAVFTYIAVLTADSASSGGTMSLSDRQMRWYWASQFSVFFVPTISSFLSLGLEYWAVWSAYYVLQLLMLVVFCSASLIYSLLLHRHIKNIASNLSAEAASHRKTVVRKLVIWLLFFWSFAMATSLIVLFRTIDLLDDQDTREPAVTTGSALLARSALQWVLMFIFVLSLAMTHDGYKGALSRGTTRAGTTSVSRGTKSGSSGLTSQAI